MVKYTELIYIQQPNILATSAKVSVYSTLSVVRFQVLLQPQEPQEITYEPPCQSFPVFFSLWSEKSFKRKRVSTCIVNKTVFSAIVPETP